MARQAEGGAVDRAGPARPGWKAPASSPAYHPAPVRDAARRGASAPALLISIRAARPARHPRPPRRPLPRCAHPHQSPAGSICCWRSARPPLNGAPGTAVLGRIGEIEGVRSSERPVHLSTKSDRSLLGEGDQRAFRSRFRSGQRRTPRRAGIAHKGPSRVRLPGTAAKAAPPPSADFDHQRGQRRLGAAPPAPAQRRPVLRRERSKRHAGCRQPQRPGRSGTAPERPSAPPALPRRSTLHVCTQNAPA